MGNMKVFLKEDEQVYLNGAHIRVDRKVSIELLNKPKFLLENHIMPIADVDTSLKQLYFIIQLIIIHTVPDDEGRKLFQETTRSVLEKNQSPLIAKLVKNVHCCVARGREYDALKMLRSAIREQDQNETKMDGHSEFGALSLAS